jgi:hypothetical protein
LSEELNQDGKNWHLAHAVGMHRSLDLAYMRYFDKSTYVFKKWNDKDLIKIIEGFSYSKNKKN